MASILLLPPRRARVLTVALADATGALEAPAGARVRRGSQAAGVYTPERRPFRAACDRRTVAPARSVFRAGHALPARPRRLREAPPWCSMRRACTRPARATTRWPQRVSVRRAHGYAEVSLREAAIPRSPVLTLATLWLPPPFPRVLPHAALQMAFLRRFSRRALHHARRPARPLRGQPQGTVGLRVAQVGRSTGPTLMYLSGGPGSAGVGEMLSVVGRPEARSRTASA